MLRLQGRLDLSMEIYKAKIFNLSPDREDVPSHQRQVCSLLNMKQHSKKIIRYMMSAHALFFPSCFRTIWRGFCNERLTNLQLFTKCAWSDYIILFQSEDLRCLSFEYRGWWGCNVSRVSHRITWIRVSWCRSCSRQTKTMLLWNFCVFYSYRQSYIFQFISHSCVKCPEGHYVNNQTKKCIACRKGISWNFCPKDVTSETKTYNLRLRNMKYYFHKSVVTYEVSCDICSRMHVYNFIVKMYTVFISS